MAVPGVHLRPEMVAQGAGRVEVRETEGSFPEHAEKAST